MPQFAVADGWMDDEDGGESTSQLTVADLIDQLSGLPSDSPVSVEGCDCINPAAKAELWDDRGVDRVLISVNL